MSFFMAGVEWFGPRNRERATSTTTRALQPPYRRLVTAQLASVEDESFHDGSVCVHADHATVLSSFGTRVQRRAARLVCASLPGVNHFLLHRSGGGTLCAW